MREVWWYIDSRGEKIAYMIKKRIKYKDVKKKNNMYK